MVLDHPIHLEEGDDEEDIYVSPQTLSTIRLELRAAVADLSARGLKLAAKWAAEQLAGLRQPSTNMDHPAGMFSGPRAWEGWVEEEAGEDEGTAPAEFSDAFLVAKACFDTGEYRRAAHVLQMEKEEAGIEGGMEGGGEGEASLPARTINQEELFLRSYASYLAGEKAKEERMMEITDQLDRCQVLNTDLQSLDGFNLYMYAVALKEMEPYLVPRRNTTPSLAAAAEVAEQEGRGGVGGGGGGGGERETVAEGAPALNREGVCGEEGQMRRPSAKSVLVEAVLAYPYNWSAWLDLAEVLCDEKQHQQRSEEGAGRGKSDPPLLEGRRGGGVGGRGGQRGERGEGFFSEQVQGRLSTLWMYDFFQVGKEGGRERGWEGGKEAERDASGQFAAYHPCVLLSTCLIDPLSLPPSLPPSPSLFLPQAQCAIARYNLRDFEEAQEGFRALQEQDPYRLENLERYSDVLYVKESRAELSQLAHIAARNDKYRPETCCIIGNYYSLKAYRRAVDINPRDYRAWYGLGQTYELLQMYLYAIYYYRKAATLRPFDARMWCALGVCYEQLDRRNEAIKCYERAVCNNDREGIATAKLARLYRDDQDEWKAARCYQRHLEARQGYQTDGSADTVDALLFLAHYHKRRHDLHTATLYCNRLLDMGGREQEEAKALLREIRSMEGQEEEEEEERRRSFSAFPVFDHDESANLPSFSSDLSPAAVTSPSHNSSGTRRMTRQQAAAAAAAAAEAMRGGERRRADVGSSPEC
ncbi:hypothetical protein NSK_000308 [Nannochloropsis salina CCMP1776]|uniref:Cdc23 domain-containing protein n=1 Tax=Nannochloropsis salina CCMP1776 TaxID=1027361 RepID=A0A4D9DIL2_9STRA|nr:hypothetical protein NSK_000308 [Nannochloropsis salina CCMP1776]|eukprot:TFJ88739.1 hypothetical protein NSK_000308 [Nannochloropsis salina CCMP1776]